MRMANGSNGRVETNKDWQVVEAVFKVWVLNYKHEFMQAKKDQKMLRNIAKNKYASDEPKGGAVIRHVVNYPTGFTRLMGSIYPEQKLQDKKFIKRFLKIIPLFQVPEKI